MTEKDSVKTLEQQSMNARKFVDQVNEAHYDIKVGDLIKLAGKLADVMVHLIEIEMGNRDK